MQIWCKNTVKWVLSQKYFLFREREKDCKNNLVCGLHCSAHSSLLSAHIIMKAPLAQCWVSSVGTNILNNVLCYALCLGPRTCLCLSQLSCSSGAERGGREVRQQLQDAVFEASQSVSQCRADCPPSLPPSLLSNCQSQVSRTSAGLGLTHQPASSRDPIWQIDPTSSQLSAACNSFFASLSDNSSWRTELYTIAQ